MKKFFSIAVCMLIVTTIFLIGSEKYIDIRLKSFVIDMDENISDRLEASFVKYEATDTKYNFYISLKNKHSRIIKIENIQMMVGDKASQESNIEGGVIFQCIELPIDGVEYVEPNGSYQQIGLDPGEERVYLFSIPKEVSFNGKADFNKVSLVFTATEYSFRINSSLYGPITSWYTPMYVKNTGEPIVIDSRL